MKIDKEIVEEAKKEIKKMIGGQTSINEESTTPGNNEHQEKETKEEPNNPSPDLDKTDKEKELEEKFKKFSEKFDGKIGRAVVEFVDDFKSNLLFIYAAKNKVNIPKEVLKMPEDGKDMCATLLDYAISDKLMEYIKKYPILAAGALFGINIGSSYLIIESLKKNEAEKKEKHEENKTNDPVSDFINKL